MKQSKYNFVPFPTEDNDAELNKERYKNIDPDICKPPFRQLIVGGTGSRKSSFLYTELSNKSIYKDVFDYIIVFNGSIDTNDGWLTLNSDKTHVAVLNEFNPDEVKVWYEKVIKQQNERRKKGLRLFVYLLIFDDFVADPNISNKNKTGIIDRIYMNGRHENISVVMLTQKYRLINPNQRANNTQSIVIMPTVNKTEIRAIANEHSGQYEDDDVIKMFNVCANDKVPLTINKKQIPKLQFWYALDRPFIIDGESQI